MKKYPIKAIALASFCSIITLGVELALIANSAWAHHPGGGEIPNSFVAGLLSGWGHPIIGIDHFVFVIAIGLLAALVARWGVILPAAFTITTAVGTAIHLQNVTLPVAELIISTSVLLMGIFLARREQTNLAWLTIVGAIAGIFHGYAYGESIIGADTSALGGYLLGFCSIQLAISLGAYFVAKQVLDQANLPLRFAGFTIAGIGFTFVSNTLLG